MVNNRFHPEKFFDHTIVADDGTVVGHIRIKPSGILWKPRNGKRWRGLSLDRFARYMDEQGTLQQK